MNKKGCTEMTKSNEDLAREIKELRDEIKQMKEIVGTLLSMIVESEGDEDEEEYGVLPGGLDIPRINN
jgi:cell division septum initiation protein DivIVA